MKNIKEILIGILAGTICGFFASGGGLVVVPAFIYILKMDDCLARGTAIFTILPMVITSSIFYYKSNFINWDIGIKASLGGIIGGIIGGILLKKIPAIYIKALFAIFLLSISIRMLLLN